MTKVHEAVRLIRTEEQHRAALAEYEAFFDDEPKPGSPEADRFELLGLVIDRYESERFPIADSDPVEVVQVVMEARGYKQADLARLFDSPSRASEILNRKRDLSVDQIRRLNREWHIPAEALLGEPRRPHPV